MSTQAPASIAELPLRRKKCWVDWYQKITTRTSVAVSGDPPPMRFARHSIASEAGTQNHHKRRSGWKQGSTATPSKSVASSETMYAYRSGSVQVIWSVGNVVPIMFLSDPSTLSMPCLKLYPSFPFVSVADPWAVVENVQV